MSTTTNLTQEEMPWLQPVLFNNGQDHRRWLFLKDWHYNKLDLLPNFADYGFPSSEILIKKGKIINGASIPKIFSNTFASTGILFIGACIHDSGYEDAGLWFTFPDNSKIFHYMTRSILDNLFTDISHLHYPEHPISIRTARLFLKIGGGAAWDSCRKIDGTYQPPKDCYKEDDGYWY